MSMANCKACGHEVSKKADKCPNCGEPLKRKPVGCGSAIAVVFLGIVIAVSWDTIKGPKSSPAAYEMKSPGKPVPLPPPVPGSQWAYSQDEDPMTSEPVSHAQVISTNTVNFSFPYSGPQRGTLLLRTHPRYGKDLIFQIEQGQILCQSYESCRLDARFDDGEAIGYESLAPEDQSTETVFIKNYKSFVGHMLKAKRVRLSVPIYQQGNQVFDFDVSDFNQEKYLPPAK